SLMVLFVKPGHCNTFKYTNLIYSGQQCAYAGMTIYFVTHVPGSTFFGG
ncbi:MAG: hypothetical protein, partial [Olavius algarvensis Gamma 3 endosymbiont]